MFDFLEGRLASSEATKLVLAVGGLGYALQTPLGTGARLGRRGDEARVFVLTVRQDELPKLLGFATHEERDLCSLLLRVAGIGPSLALALLSADSPRRLLQAIQQEDVAWLKRVKGVGAKTAQRICLEIKDRAGKWLALLGPEGSGPPPEQDPIRTDAEQALVALGFAQSEAETRVEKARSSDPEAPVEALVKSALRG